jgi:hypothetical protein
MSDAAILAMNAYYERLSDADLLALMRDDGRCKAMLDEGVPCRERALPDAMICTCCAARFDEA